MWPTAVLKKISLLAYFFIIVAIKTNVINLEKIEIQLLCEAFEN